MPFRREKLHEPPVLKLSGFSLIELLVVIVVIGILAAILTATVGEVRRSARKTQLISRLRQVGAAGLSYVADNKGRLPWFHQQPATGGAIHWQLSLGPYISRVNSNMDINIKDLAFGEDYVLHDPLDTTVNPYLNKPVPNIALNGKARIYLSGLPAGTWGNVPAGASGRPINTIANPGKLALFGPGQSGAASMTNNWPWDNLTTTLSAKDIGGSDAFRYKDSTFFVFCDGHVDQKTREWVLAQAALGDASPFFDPSAINP
ncbi:MAG: type II secretion system protein [Opitutaceae bacterium]|jgi:prepilin-type N-terminal cleavage/methylation domain-containing protein